MLVAEALNERKAAYAKAKALVDEISTVAIYDSDEYPENPDKPKALVTELSEVLARASALTIAINLANNRATLTFNGRDFSLMEAISLRDELTMLITHRETIQTALDEALGKKRRRYGLGYAERRSKDDIKEVSLIDRDAFRAETDGLADQRRLLDVAIQRVNWSAEI